MRQMFHLKHGVDAPPTTCMRSPKRKGSEIDASPQLPISTGVQSLDRSRLPWSVRSIDRRSAIMPAQLMYSYATRGLGFLVRCATISRLLGQGRQRSGGSPLFMINHRSSRYNISVNTGMDEDDIPSLVSVLMCTYVRILLCMLYIHTHTYVQTCTSLCIFVFLSLQGELLGIVGALDCNGGVMQHLRSKLDSRRAKRVNNKIQ